MNPDEWRALAEATVAKEQARVQPHMAFFLPFLRLDAGVTVGGVEFLPLRDKEGQVPSALEPVEKALTRILSGYVERSGRAFDNCVVATIPGRGWDLTRADGPMITWATQLLFLSSWACNEYFERFGGTYINASYFRLSGQEYTGDVPNYISLWSRRCDGGTTTGGYEHGEVKFYVPLQCSLNDTADVDEAFAIALDKANSANSDTLQRLRTSLPFVQLANTDD